MPDLTAEQITDLTLPQAPQISPDGRFVTYTLAGMSKRDEFETSTLWMAATDDSEAPWQFTAGTAHDHSPRWSPDGSQLAFLSDRAKRGTDQLYLISAVGGEARALTDTEHDKPVETFLWSPGGGQIAFTSVDEPTEEDKRRDEERDDARVYGERPPYVRLRLVSVATGEVTTLAGGERHVASFAWAPQGTGLAYLVRAAPALEHAGRADVVEYVPLAGAEARVVCRLPAGGSVAELAWSRDGETLLLLAPVGFKNQSSYAVHTVPASGGEPTHLALGENSCAGGLQQPLGSDRAVVEVGRGLATELHWLDPKTGTLEALYTLSEDDPSDLLGWNARPLEGGGAVVAVVKSTGDKPWELHVGRTEPTTGPVALQQLTHHQTALSGLTFGPQIPFTWTAADGLALDGWLVRPPDTPGGPLPTLVLVHGGPYGRWGGGLNLSWAAWAQWLALAGYAVLLPNPRGGYGHGERFAASVRGAVGKEDFGDVMAMVDAAVAGGIADPERLGIGGWSQGGFMSAWAVTQTNRFRAAIMGAGVSDWGLMVQTSDVPDFERELGGSAPWDGVGPHPHAAISPISFARDVKTPVLILHGENDERVPLSQAVGFHRALRETEVPTELVVYPREPHGIRERAHQIDLLERVRSWYDRWLNA